MASAFQTVVHTFEARIEIRDGIYYATTRAPRKVVDEVTPMGRRRRISHSAATELFQSLNEDCCMGDDELIELNDDLAAELWTEH